MPIDQVNSKCVKFKMMTDLMAWRYRERLLGHEVESKTDAEKFLNIAEMVVAYIMEATGDEYESK